MSTLPPGLERIARATAALPFDAGALCAAVEDWVSPATRHALFTVNRLDAGQLRLTRVHSSDPVAYPPGGTKDKRGMPWGQHVLVEKKEFIGEGADAIRQFFDDADAIAALRLRAIVNVPVVERSACLGTANFLVREERITEELLAYARLAALLLVPALR